MEENLSSTTLIDISRYCSSFADGDLWSSSSQSTSSRSPTTVQRLFSPTPTRSSDSDSPILPSLPLPPSHWSLTSTFNNLQLDNLSNSLWSSTSQSNQTCSCCRCLKTENFSSKSNSSNRIISRPRSIKEDSSLINTPKSIQHSSNVRRSIRTSIDSRLSKNIISSTKNNLSSKFSVLNNFYDENKQNQLDFDNENLTDDNDNEHNQRIDDHQSFHHHHHHHFSTNSDNTDDDNYDQYNGQNNHHEDNDEDNLNSDDGTLRLHVSNIPFTWSKEKLAEVFGIYGTTFDVEVVYNERGSKGFGFVTFLAKKDALEAKKRMDREIVDGRRLVVNFAKPKQKSNSSSKDRPTFSLNHLKTNQTTWKTNHIHERSSRQIGGHHYQSLGFSTPPTARRQNLAGFASLSSTPTRSTITNSSQRYYL